MKDQRESIRLALIDQITHLLPDGYMLRTPGHFYGSSIVVHNNSGDFTTYIHDTTTTDTAFELVRRVVPDRYSVRFATAYGSLTRWYEYSTLEEAITTGCTRHKMGAYKGAT